MGRNRSGYQAAQTRLKDSPDQRDVAVDRGARLKRGTRTPAFTRVCEILDIASDLIPPREAPLRWFLTLPGLATAVASATLSHWERAGVRGQQVNKLDRFLNLTGIKWN